MEKYIVLPILLRLIRLSIYLIFCGILLSQIINDFDLLKDVYDGDLNLLFLLKYFYFSNRLIQVLIVLIGFAGFFIKNPIGWTLQSTFFYFFVFMPIFMNESQFLLFEIAQLLIPISFVFLMNLRVVTNEYNLKTENILTYNLGSIFSSLLITYLWGLFILNSNYSFWEIIEKINN